MPSLRYGTQTIHYEILRKASLKHTYIEVGKKGVVVRTNTRITEEEITTLVGKKSRWILRHLRERRVNIEEGEIRTGSRLRYLGKGYYVRLISEKRNDIDVRFIHSKFLISIPENTSRSDLQKAVDLFYRRRAEEKIPPLIAQWSPLMGVVPARVSFRRAERRWGSCSSENRLSFNYHLMKLPKMLIEYVVVHELAHILHKNHSREFWRTVGNLLPDYREREAKIRAYEKVL